MAEPEPEPEPQPEPEPVADVVGPEPVAPVVEPEPLPALDVTEAETGTIARRPRFRRRKPEERPHETPPAPKHVRVLPAPETAVAAEAELPPWERGFDETDERRR